MYFVIVQIFIVLREFKPVTNTHSSLTETKASQKESSFSTETPLIKLLAGFVRVLENLESHGNLKFQNPGLENLENMCWSLKVLEN